MGGFYEVTAVSSDGVLDVIAASLALKDLIILNNMGKPNHEVYPTSKD